MVPYLPWWEFIKGFLREDVSEVMVLGWHHVLERPANLSLLRFLGQLLRWGTCSPNVVFCPLRVSWYDLLSFLSCLCLSPTPSPSPSDSICLPSATSAPTPRCTHANMLHPCLD